MLRSSTAVVLCCAGVCSAVDVVVLDQIGDGSALHDSQGNVFGYFNHYSTPPVGFGNRGVLDDFHLSSRTRLTRIEAVVAASPGAPVNFANLIGWRVEVYSNPQIALNADLRGDLYHAQVQTPTSLTNPFVAFVYGGNPIVKASFDVDVTLDAGMYWVAVIPVNTTSNGYAVSIGSTIGNAFNPWQVLPGNTVLPLSQAGIGFRIMGAEPCYANCDQSTTAPVLNIGDFTCFLQKFAAGDAYANCDGSTEAPVLNVADFSCFLQKFAGGCT